MSKHLGNILLPMPLMEDHGADALRWFMAASGSPWLQRRVGHGVLQEIVRKTLLTYWNTASFLTLYGNANDWSPLETPVPDVARPAGAGPVAALGDPPAGAGRHRRLRGVRHPAGGAAAGRARRRHVQLVRTPVAAPVLGGRPVRAGHAARVPVRRDAAARAGGAVRDRAGLAGRRAPGLAGRAGLGAPGRLAAGRRRPGRRGAGRPGRPRSAGWSSSAGRPGPSPRSATGSRWAGPWWLPPAGTRCPTSCAARWPTSSTWWPSSELAGELVDRSAKGNFRALGKRFGKDTPTVAAAIAAADAGRAGRSAAGRVDGHRGRGRRRRRGDRRGGAAHRDPAGGLGGRDARAARRSPSTSP